MTAKGTVKAVHGAKATVEIRRRAMCDGCPNDPSDPNSCGHSCAMGAILGERKSMSVTVDNVLNARVGDQVELESSDGLVLSSAFLVFILPIVLAASFYLLASVLTLAEPWQYAFAIAGFLLSFVFCLSFERRAKKNGKRIVMRAVISEPHR